MGNPIKIGIVGIGRAGYGMHCEELKGKEDMFQIVAACDLIEERRKKMEERYGCRVYERIEDLIADPEVEMVDIATRSRDHFAHAMLALKAGKSVCQEKPFCETYAQAKELKEFCSKPNAPKIYARHNRRFECYFEKISELIKTKQLGRIYEIHITRNSYSRRDDWQTLSQFGGGQLLNWGPHIIDQSLRFIDGRYKSMFSTIKHTVAAGDCEDHIKIVFEGENGITVDMQISGGVALPCPEYMVFGTRGALTIQDNKIHMRYIDPAQILEKPIADSNTPGQTFGASGTFSSNEEIKWVEKTIEGRSEDLSLIWKYMYDDYRNGITYPISIDEAIEVIKVIEQVKRGTEFESKL